MALRGELGDDGSVGENEGKRPAGPAREGEFQHSIRNNLQIVSSLLQLRAARADAGTRQAIGDLQLRVRALAIVYGHFVQAARAVNAGPCIAQVVSETFQAHGRHGGRIFSAVSVGDRMVALEQALPSSLIVVELVSNCLRHAFPNDQRGRIEVTLSFAGERALLVVADDGVSLPAGFDISDANSFGFTVVKGLVQQLQGRLQIQTGRGTQLRIDFPCPPPTPSDPDDAS
jgi:two-component sensor histidine kinase